MLTAGYPKILGIVNITEDSFSDGGRYLETQAAIDHALALIKSGADIIDLGPASSNPDVQPAISELIDKETTDTLAPASIRVAIFLVATLPPPTTTQGFPVNFKYIG